MLLCADISAQQYQFVYYTPRDGLVNSRVRSIKQDSRGRMLFVTYGGISIYDGTSFTNYQQQDGLANELTNDIMEITPDSFLIAVNLNALNTLVKGKIGAHQTSDGFIPIINKFFRSQDGSLYVIADEGLYLFAENTFTRIPLTNPSGIEIGNNLSRISEWENFFFLVPWNFAQRDQLIVYDKLKKTVIGTITDKSIASVVASPTGELWLSSNEGIDLVDQEALRKGYINLLPLPSNHKAQGWINSNIYFDQFGTSWIFSHNTVLYITSTGKTQLLSATQGLRTSTLSEIFVDREGNTWMASDGNGIVKLTGTKVRTLTHMTPEIKMNVSAMIQHGDTTWLYNTTDNSFYRMHGEDRARFRLGRDNAVIHEIYVHGKSLYFITDNMLFQISDKDAAASYSNFTRIYPLASDSMALGVGKMDPNGVIIQLVRDANVEHYLAAISNGKLWMKEKLSYVLDHVAISNDGILWVPTRDLKLKAYSLHPETPMQYIRLKEDYSAKVKYDNPRSIAIDNLSNIWIGTRYDGIYRFQMKDGQIESASQVTTAQGLTDNFPILLYCDRSNHIWAGSQSGLDKITYSAGNFTVDNVTKSKNIFQSISRIINIDDHVIWALTTNGEVIEVSDINGQLPVSTVSFFIAHLSVNDSTYTEGENVFSYNENNFSIGVAAPSFTDEKSILYSYWLKGGNKNNWSKPSNQAVFNFINLAPGHYTLHVKAQFPARMYPDQELIYSFTIRPPYYQTWWFILLVSLLVISGLGLIVRYYYNQKLEKQKNILERKQAIEQERTRIATDMHDDLGAGLSRIKFLSETIGIRKQQHLPVDEEITNIRHYAHEMIDKMGEIVWALNEKNDSLHDLLSYTRAYAMEYLAENGIKNNIDKLPPLASMMVNGEFRRNIFLSVKETLHNIIKHARANVVFIKFHVSDKLVISIKDDGIGFDPEAVQFFGNGLSNIKKRMNEINGSMEIKNDQGTCIILTAPLPS